MSGLVMPGVTFPTGTVLNKTTRGAPYVLQGGRLDGFVWPRPGWMLLLSYLLERAHRLREDLRAA